MSWADLLLATIAFLAGWGVSHYYYKRSAEDGNASTAQVRQDLKEQAIIIVELREAVNISLSALKKLKQEPDKSVAINDAEDASKKVNAIMERATRQNIRLTKQLFGDVLEDQAGKCAKCTADLTDNDLYWGPTYSGGLFTFICFACKHKEMLKDVKVYSFNKH